MLGLTFIDELYIGKECIKEASRLLFHIEHHYLYSKLLKIFIEFQQELVTTNDNHEKSHRKMKPIKSQEHVHDINFIFYFS